MDKANIALGIAAGLILGLLALLIFTSPPEKAQFQETLAPLGHQEGIVSDKQPEAHTVASQDIEHCLERIAILNGQINAIAGGPAPDVTPEDSLQMVEYTFEIAQLRKKIRRQLNRLKMVTQLAQNSRLLTN
ncbi:MAG: hypothetical protein AAGF77_06285 [Bacteroidota bacterium]